MATSMISLRDVTKRFPNASAPAVGGLSLDVLEGETLVLVGPSGCGKTTALRMINRLIEPTSGSISIGGRETMEMDPVELRRGIGYVIQSVGLLPHRTVGDNIGTVPRLLGWDAGRVAERVRQLTELLELQQELLDRYPSELSGGQRQRVGVARALAADPPIMLMDEPFAAVDPIVRARLQEQFLDIQARLRKTIVFVTHDVDEAIIMADRIAILNVGGVLEQLAPPEEILKTPANEFVKRFVGSERTLKRLSLILVSDLHLDPPGAADADGAVVDPGATVREALDAILAAGATAIRVVDGGGNERGVLTLDHISREVAR
jgi:osmoprotectant transport system ATP-binding protein